MHNEITILLADDEIDVLEFMQYSLEKEGYKVYTASNGKDAVNKALETDPDLIVLDVMMPEMDGFEACKILREMNLFDHTIITFLTARDEDYAQIAGLDVGADDYITKPIKPRLLVSKINALLRRKNKLSSKDIIGQTYAYKDIVIDKKMYEVRKQGISITLPKKEFELLYLLMSNPQKVFAREEIMEVVWGDTVVGDRTIDVHIRKLRQKIGEAYFKTVKGVGYSLR